MDHRRRNRVRVQNVLDILDCDESDINGYMSDSDSDEDYNSDTPNNQGNSMPFVFSKSCLLVFGNDFT